MFRMRYEGSCLPAQERENYPLADGRGKSGSNRILPRMWPSDARS